MRIGHPTGTIQVEIEVAKRNGEIELTRAALARLLMDGFVYGPNR